MTLETLVPAEVARRFEVFDWRNGLAILAAVHLQEWAKVAGVLSSFTLRHSDIARGGNKSAIARARRRAVPARLG